MSGECFWTVPGTFWRLFGVPGPEAPGDIFETFLGFRARRARETSVRGGLVPNFSRNPPALTSINRRKSVHKSRNLANKGLPLPLGRGVRETKSKNGRSRPRTPFISRVFCAQRGIGTMVSEGARPWGRGRSGDCEK